MGLEVLALVIGIHLGGEGGQRAQVDTVAVLQAVKVVVAQADAQDGEHTHPVSGHCADPLDVVIAPLNVHAAVAHKFLHNEVGPGTAVKDVAQNVELIHGNLLEHPADGHDEGISDAAADGGVDELLVVAHLVGHHGILGDEVVDDVGEFGVDDLGHPLAVILGGHLPQHLHQPVNHQRRPVLVVGFGAALALGGQEGMGVGDEGGQFVALFFRQGEGVHRVDLVADDAGGGAEQLDKGAVFTV